MEELTEDAPSVHDLEAVAPPRTLQSSSKDAGKKAEERGDDDVDKEEETQEAELEANGKPKLPRPTVPVSCPRCASEETKFCYYNNYNIKQPRYFCRVSFMIFFFFFCPPPPTADPTTPPPPPQKTIEKSLFSLSALRVLS